MKTLRVEHSFYSDRTDIHTALYWTWSNSVFNLLGQRLLIYTWKKPCALCGRILKINLASLSVLLVQVSSNKCSRQEVQQKSVYIRWFLQQMSTVFVKHHHLCFYNRYGGDPFFFSTISYIMNKTRDYFQVFGRMPSSVSSLYRAVYRPAVGTYMHRK